MSENREMIESLQQMITNEFFDKISIANTKTAGIFETLKKLAEQAELKGLAIFLCIAEHQPIKHEDIVRVLNNLLAKSTIYRKCKEFEEKGLLMQDGHGRLSLSPSLETLRTIAQIHTQMKKVKKS